MKSHESSCGGHKQHDPEMEKSLEFVGAEYAYLKGLYVAAKKDLKALDERLTFPSAQVDEMTIEIDNLVQQRYNFNFKLAGVPEIAEPRSKESALDTTKLCVRIFEAMGFNKCEVIYGKGKGKVTLFNVGSSFSYETGINGTRRCSLYPPCLCQCSVLRVFKGMATRIRGKWKQTLKSLKIEPDTCRLESRALVN